MGKTTKTETKRDFKTFDPFTQLGIGQGQRNELGQQAFGATQQGLGDLQNISGGRFMGGRTPEQMFGLLGGGGGGGGGRGRGRGGGGGGGLIGGVMGLGPEAMALKQDPFDDPFINKVFGQGTEVARGQHAVAQQNLSDMLARKGVSGPAAMALRAQMESSAASQQAQQAEQRALGLGQERLQNQRLLAGQETDLRGKSRMALASERGSVAALRGQRVAASASRFGSSMAARAGLLNTMLGQSGAAAGTLGTGGAMRGIGAPFDIKTSGEQTTQKEGGGLGGILGGALGIGSMLIPGMQGVGAGLLGGGFGNMFGGGGGSTFSPSPAGALNRPLSFGNTFGTRR